MNREKFRTTVIYPAIAFLLVIAVVWNEIREDKDHNHFFHDVRGFISEGGRNTARDGYILCIAIKNHLVEEHRLSYQLDCEKYLEREKHVERDSLDSDS